MIITTSDSNFKYETNIPILNEDGTEVDESLYEISEEGTFEEVSMTDKLTIVLDGESTSSFELGDNVIVSVNGFEYPNVITIVNPTSKQYKISKPIIQYTGEIKIKKNFFVYTLSSNLPNGYYHLTNNELIIINNSFLNITIDYNTLITKDKRCSSLLEPSDIPSYNKTGLDEIYADFSYIPDFHRYLDGPVLKVLLCKKILALIEESHWDGSSRYKESYNSAKDKYILNFKTDKEGKTEVEEQIEESNGGWSFRLGA